MKRLLVLFFVVGCIGHHSIAQESIIDSYSKADSIFYLVKNKYKYDRLLTYKRFYSGKEYLRGHFYRPNSSEIYDVTCEYEFQNKTYSIKSTINYNGTSYTAQYKLDKDSCTYNEYGDSEIRKKSHGNIFEYFSDPINILYNISENKPSLHLAMSLNPEYYIIGFNDMLNNKYYVYINTKTLLIEQLYKFFYDKNYGNSYEKMGFEDYTLDGLPIPQKVHYFVANNIKKDLTLNNVENIQFSDKSLENIDNEFSFVLDTIAKETYLIKFVGLENKVLILKNQDCISVFESPVNPIISSELIKYLDKKFNGLEIKYLYLTHHHPDHAAGIKAFADIGCTIIAPSPHIAYLDSLVHIQHSFNNYYGIYKKTPIYKLIEKNAKAVHLDNGKVIAYEIGENTGHSECFILYYLPFQNILFTSDLVYFSSAKIRPQGKRAYSIYELIKNEKIKTSNLKLIPSFLISNHKDIGTYSDLIDCLKENYPDIK